MATTTEPIVLTVLYERDERGWVRARVSECPAIVTCGRDRDEARAMAADALRELLLSHTVSRDVLRPGNGADHETLVVTIAPEPLPGATG
jgi:hypothetical protein